MINNAEHDFTNFWTTWAWGETKHISNIAQSGGPMKDGED